jgi:hypothetical protein
MSTNRNGPKRLTPTTVILVLVLLGAVAGASRLVSPPPPGPPEVKPPPKAPPIASQEKMKAMQDAEMVKNKEMMRQAHMGAATAKIPVVADPNAMVIDNKWFINTKPGEQGLKQVDEEQKRKKAEYQAYLKKVAVVQGKAAVPQDKPVVAPAK